MAPAMVTDVPTGPDVGLREVMLGPGVVTVNATPLLATPPTVTTTLPVVAPLGTGATMLDALQFVGVAAMPLKVTVLVPWLAPKLEPAMVTEAPIAPEFGVRLMMFGGGSVTVKGTLLLAVPPTVTTTFPVVAPEGTGTTMLVALQLVGVPAVPLKVTVLVPWVAPKFEPEMVTEVPTTPDVGFKFEMFGTLPPPPPAALKAARTAPQMSDALREALADAFPATFWIWSSSINLEFDEGTRSSMV